ncbi:MAG: hypothetical protein K0R28_2771 [Paenibacillus sp.]|jgi:hypothetical protein|nr:hypothetical protein [Paenibacillus sp.]
MWGTLTIILFAGIAGTVELPALARRSAKEAAVYVVMLAAGALLGIAAVRLKTLPNPLGILVVLFKPINDWLGQLFM